MTCGILICLGQTYFSLTTAYSLLVYYHHLLWSISTIQPPVQKRPHNSICKSPAHPGCLRGTSERGQLRR